MPDARCQMPDAGCQMPDVRCQMPDARCQMSDVRCQMPDARCQMPQAGTGRGSRGREGATHQLKRIFGYEIHFKRDLPRDVESINQKAQLKSLRSYF